ncbi:P-loop containing nucleoside triphosphate hydrolase protein [Hyaloraphidium curvatum]|nr:P-loop containing nucleoside triphosphate hydrolase protein [Hyaloraphidium curvatum]
MEAMARLLSRPCAAVPACEAHLHQRVGVRRFATAARSPVRTPAPRLSAAQLKVVEHPASHRVVWAVAGSGKTEVLVKAGLRAAAGGSNVLVLTKISSVTEEIRSRLRRDAPHLNFQRKGKSHWIARNGKSSVEVANFDAAVHYSLAAGANQWGLARFRGDSFRHKTERLLSAVLDGTGPPAPLLCDGSRADLLLVDEAQDLEPPQVALLAAFAAQSMIAGHDFRTVLVGDPLQTVFDRSIVEIPESDGFQHGLVPRPGNRPQVIQPRGLHALDAWTKSLEKLGSSATRFDLNVCHRCPDTHLKLVNAVMKPIQTLYGAAALEPGPKQRRADPDTMPFFFVHPVARDNTTSHIVAAQAVAIIASLMDHDPSLQPEHIAVLATTTNANAAFSQLQPLLSRLYEQRGFPVADAALHFRTRDEVGILAINWDAADGRTPMVSIHGEKGKEHRAVVLLDASGGVLPALHRAGRAIALVDASLLNVGLTRSTRYLAIGYRDGHPSAYLASHLHLDSERPDVAGFTVDDGVSLPHRVAYCSWALPSHSPELHRKLAAAVSSVPGAPRRFTPPVTKSPMRTDHPIKNIVTVSIDASQATEFEHPSNLVPGWSPGAPGRDPGSALAPTFERAFPFDQHLALAKALQSQDASSGDPDTDGAQFPPDGPSSVPVREVRFGQPFALFRDQESRTRHAELAPVTGSLAELLFERIVKHDRRSSRRDDKDQQELAPESTLAASYSYLLETKSHCYSDDDTLLNLAADAQLNRLALVANQKLDRRKSAGSARARWLEALESAEARVRDMFHVRGAGRRPPSDEARRQNLLASLKRLREHGSAAGSRKASSRVPYLLPSLVKQERFRTALTSYLSPDTPTRDLRPDHLWSLALGIAMLHGEVRRPQLLRYWGAGPKGKGRGASSDAHTPVRPEAYTQLLANVEGMAALLAREHHRTNGDLGLRKNRRGKSKDKLPVVLSFEDEHSLSYRCAELDGAFVGVGARSDVIVEDHAAAALAGSGPSLAKPVAGPAPLRRLIEIKCPAVPSTEIEGRLATCSNVWWNQALLYAVLSKRPIHAVSVADVAAGVLYTAPVVLTADQRVAALRRVFEAFRFPAVASDTLSGLLRSRIEAGEEDDRAPVAEAGQMRPIEVPAASIVNVVPKGLPKLSGMGPGRGWMLVEELGLGRAG